MNHIIAFSGGIASSVMASLVLRDHPQAILLYHSTRTEPEDNDRFRQEVSSYLKTPITEDSDGRDIWQVFEDEDFLGNDLHPICSRILKAERSKKYLQDHQPAILYVGYTMDEYRRAQRLVARYAKQHVPVRFPLIDGKVSKEECFHRVVNCWKLHPPRVYKWADHANCIPCVRGKLAYWGIIALYYPDQWERAAQAEEAFSGFILNPNEYGSLREERAHCLRLAQKYLQKKDGKDRQEDLFAYPCECAM